MINDDFCMLHFPRFKTDEMICKKCGFAIIGSFFLHLKDSS